MGGASVVDEGGKVRDVCAFSLAHLAGVQALQALTEAGTE